VAWFLLPFEHCMVGDQSAGKPVKSDCQSSWRKVGGGGGGKIFENKKRFKVLKKKMQQTIF